MTTRMLPIRMSAGNAIGYERYSDIGPVESVLCPACDYDPCECGNNAERHAGYCCCQDCGEDGI